MGHRQYFVYLLTNYTKTVLYIGITSSLDQRIQQHKHAAFEGFTKRYHCDRLVYFVEYGEVDQAIAREKQIKAGRGQKRMLWSRLRIQSGTISPPTGKCR